MEQLVTTLAWATNCLQLHMHIHISALQFGMPKSTPTSADIELRRVAGKAIVPVSLAKLNG